MPITRELRSPRQIDHDLAQLTNAERLFLWRHRQPTAKNRFMNRHGRAMSQDEAADRIGVRRGIYNKLEAGLSVLASFNVNTEGGSFFALSEALSFTSELVPTIGELCFLARRRSGKTLTAIEQEIGLSRPTYLEGERIGDRRVVGYWCDQGFAFPVAEEVAA